MGQKMIQRLEPGSGYLRKMYVIHIIREISKTIQFKKETHFSYCLLINLSVGLSHSIHLHVMVYAYLCFPGDSGIKKPTCQCKRHMFDP